MGATFEDIKSSICKAIMEKERPELLVKSMLDAMCLLRKLYQVDIDRVISKWNRGEEI